MLDNGHLQIRGIKKTDEGFYNCEARVAARGEIDYKKISVIVNGELWMLWILLLQQKLKPPRCEPCVCPEETLFLLLLSSSQLSGFQSFLAFASGSRRSTLRPTWALRRCWRVTQTAFLTPSSPGRSRSLSAPTPTVFSVEFPAGSEGLNLTPSLRTARRRDALVLRGNWAKQNHLFLPAALTSGQPGRELPFRAALLSLVLWLRVSAEAPQM